MRVWIRVAMAGALSWGSAGALTLEDCLEAAFEHSPVLAAARARTVAAAAGASEARSAWYPTLTAYSRLETTDHPPGVFMMQLQHRDFSFESDPNRAGRAENLRLGAGVQWRLADGGARHQRLEAARRGRDAARDGLRAAANEVAHQVTGAWYETLKAHGMVEVQEERLVSYREHLRVARERAAAGAAIRTDVLNLEVQAASAEQDLIRARNAVERNVALLNARIGTDLVRPAQVAAAAARPEPTPPDAADLGGDARHHPAVRARAAEAEGARAEARAARRDHAPVLSAFASTDWDSPADTRFEHSVTAGLALTWELFAGGRRMAAQAGAEARSLEQDARRREAEDRVDMDRTQARLDVAEAEQRLAVASRALESAGESARITRDQYAEGAASLADVLTAQAGLAQIRSQRLAAHYDLLTARSRLEHALGVRGQALDRAARPAP